MPNRLPSVARLARRLCLASLSAALMLAAPVHAQTAKEAPKEAPLNLKPLFDAAGTQGTMLIYDVRAARLYAYNPQRAREAYSPASTFKIFNSLIGLETGAVADVDNDKIPWDGKVWTHHGKPILPAVCNGDVSLRLALKNSCVPAYQALARRGIVDSLNSGAVAISPSRRNIGHRKAAIQP